MKKDAGMKVDNKKGEGSESESEKEDEKNEEYEDEEDIMIWGYEKNLLMIKYMLLFKLNLIILIIIQ